MSSISGDKTHRWYDPYNTKKYFYSAEKLIEWLKKEHGNKDDVKYYIQNTYNEVGKRKLQIFKAYVREKIVELEDNNIVTDAELEHDGFDLEDYKRSLDEMEESLSNLSSQIATFDDVVLSRVLGGANKKEKRAYYKPFKQTKEKDIGVFTQMPSASCMSDLMYEQSLAFDQQKRQMQEMQKQMQQQMAQYEKMMKLNQGKDNTVDMITDGMEHMNYKTN